MKKVSIMKKIPLIGIILCLLFLSACDFFNVVNTDNTALFDSVYEQIYQDVDFDYLTETFYVPSTLDGVSITYSTSNDALKYEDNYLIVTRPEAHDTTLFLTTKLSKGSSKKTYNEVVLIPKVEDVNFTTFWTQFSNYQKSANANFPTVENNLDFVESLNGYSLSYSSSNLSILSNSGIINRSNVDTNVILTVTASKGSQTDTNLYTIKVLAVGVVYNPIPDAYSELEASFLVSNPEYPILTANLSFPTTLLSVIFTYSSSNTSALSNTGVVYRTNTDVVVNLVVNASYQGSGDSRTYILTIKELNTTSASDYEAYIYQNGGGTGSAANPIKLINNVQNTVGETVGLPTVSTASGSTISLNPIVVPIAFSDIAFTSSKLEIIEKGFFGTEEDTGWESLQTYYQKSSFNRVNINGTVIPTITLDMTSTQAYNTYGEYIDYYCMQLLFTTYASSVNWANHDANGDGVIDAIYFVYSKAYSQSASMPWWAYKYEYYVHGSWTSLTASGKKPGVYMWASYSFFNDSLGASVSINAETFCHETGHIFGLDDYYSYDYDSSSTNDGGLGGADMMDYNNGDHGPFNKIILGWITPMIVTESITVKIYKANDTGQVLLIPKSWNHSYFSEYLLIDYYTPDALYAKHASVSTYNNYMFHQAGIRIYYVDSTSSSSAVFKYTNTDTGGGHMLIKYISASTNNPSTSGKVTNADLFSVSSTYNWSNFSWYDGSKTFTNIKVLEVASSYAIIQITY